MSMEEERARQDAAAAAEAQTSGASSGAVASSVAVAEPPTVPAEPTDDEEEAMLRQALAMSEGQDVDMAAATEGDEDMTEEEAIARAIEMSMKPQEEQQQGKDKK